MLVGVELEFFSCAAITVNLLREKYFFAVFFFFSNRPVSKQRRIRFVVKRNAVKIYYQKATRETDQTYIERINTFRSCCCCCCCCRSIIICVYAALSLKVSKYAIYKKKQRINDKLRILFFINFSSFFVFFLSYVFATEW